MHMKKRAGQAGFTLIELLVVVLIIGILAAIAVPQYFKVVEKGKAAEALDWLGAVKSAQERYLAKYGVYNAATTGFDVTLGAMTNFTPPAAIATGTNANGPAWTISIQRYSSNGTYPAVYGQYNVIYQAPYSGTEQNPSCDNTSCLNDLMP